MYNTYYIYIYIYILYIYIYIGLVLEATFHKTAAVWPPTTYLKHIQIRITRDVGHCWRSKCKLISNVLLWLFYTDKQGLTDHLEPIYNSCVLIQDVAWKTCRERMMIEMSGERESGKPVQAARHGDVYVYCMSVLSLLENH